VANFAHSLSICINGVLVEAVEDPEPVIRPIESSRWLTGQLAQFGLQLGKGQMILTGSPMKLYPVAPGSRIVVEAPPLGASVVEVSP
jgi:2-keto-4-pentenoate hydratase